MICSILIAGSNLTFSYFSVNFLLRLSVQQSTTSHLNRPGQLFDPEVSEAADQGLLTPGGTTSALPAAAAAGCASVFMLVVIAVVLLIRRRPLHASLELKRKTTVSTAGQSPVVWLQRHDGNRVFDRLTVVTTNEAYYSRDLLDESVLVNVQTKLIPIDDLKLEKEIGEGTFGKVYKGLLR